MSFYSIHFVILYMNECVTKKKIILLNLVEDENNYLILFQVVYYLALILQVNEQFFKGQ